jgi:branched-subunit amino acid transport protein
MWPAILLGSLGCYLFKLAGLSMPRRVLDHPRVARVATLLPIALLTALIVVQTFTTGHRVVPDARAAGLGVTVVAILCRAPFLVVVIAAAVATALVRLWFLSAGS